jgi:hypothetical protein
VFHFQLLTMFCHINHMLRNLVVTQSVRRIESRACPDRACTELSVAAGQAADHAFSSRGWNALRPAGPRVGDRSRASPKPRAQPALGRACARRYGRHLGRGSPPRRPSSRFHDFAPREPNWPVAAPQTDSKSFDVLPQEIRAPGRSARTDGSQKTAHYPSAGGSSPGQADVSPQSRCVYVLAISPARDDRAFISGPSQRALSDYSRLDAGFSPGVVKKTRGSWQAPADLPTS